MVGTISASAIRRMEPNSKIADHIELIDETHFRWAANVAWDNGKAWTLENQISNNVRVK